MITIPRNFGYGGSGQDTVGRPILAAIIDSLNSIVKSTATAVANESLTDSGDGLTFTFENNNVLLDSVTIKNAITAIETLTITAETATADGNVTITLDGEDTTIAVVTGDTAAQVAAKIKAGTFEGWTTGGNGANVTFTATVAEPKAAPVYAPGDTGAAGTIVNTRAGLSSTIIPANDIAEIEYAYSNDATNASVTFKTAKVGTVTASYLHIASANPPTISIAYE